VETGLRLIAQDMRSGRLASTVRLVAEELERGTPLGEAFDKHRAKFPSLYGRLLEAGVKSGDLSGVLLNLGRHVEMVQRLRSMLWRTFSYPLTVLTALAVVMLFLGFYVLPQFRELYIGFGLKLPMVTDLLLDIATAIPYVAGAMLLVVLLTPLALGVLRVRGREVHLRDAVGLRLPLVGRALRLNLIARWCDALRIGVAAGLDLPAAIALAGDAVRSPRLAADGQALTARLEAGQPLTSAAGELSLLPATVPATIELSAGHHDLPETLRTLAEMYERQAELRTSVIPAVLTPILVIGVALSVGFVILALLMPVIQLIEGISGAK
jgi:type IV pilus assembly protein PilC